MCVCVCLYIVFVGCPALLLSVHLRVLPCSLLGVPLLVLGHMCCHYDPFLKLPIPLSWHLFKFYKIYSFSSSSLTISLTPLAHMHTGSTYKRTCGICLSWVFSHPFCYKVHSFIFSIDDSILWCVCTEILSTNLSMAT